MTYPACPDGLTVPAVIAAKGDQLRYWIDAANKVAKAAGQPVIKKKQLVDTLRNCLAAHYGLDLSVIHVDVVIGPAPVNRAIINAQWGHLRSMAGAWSTAAESGMPFNLLVGSTTGVFL